MAAPDASCYTIKPMSCSQIEADKREKIWKEKLSISVSGPNNPMYGKPSPPGSGNGWSGWYKGWFFRSLKELKAVLSFEQENLQWATAEKKEYIKLSGMVGNYFPDFVIEKNKIIECKPKNLWDAPSVKIKTEAAIIKFLKMGMEFEIIDPGTLTNIEIDNLVETNQIKFTDRYAQKYLKRKMNEGHNS